MALIEIDKDRYISNKGIMSIRVGYKGEVTIRYISGETETVDNISMSELLIKLDRMPRELRRRR